MGKPDSWVKTRARRDYKVIKLFSGSPGFHPINPDEWGVSGPRAILYTVATFGLVVSGLWALALDAADDGHINGSILPFIDPVRPKPKDDDDEDDNDDLEERIGNNTVAIADLQNETANLNNQTLAFQYSSDWSNLNNTVKDLGIYDDIYREIPVAKSAVKEYFIQTNNTLEEIENLYKIPNKGEKYLENLIENYSIIASIKERAEQVGDDNLTEEEYDSLREAKSNIKNLLEKEKIGAFANIIDILYTDKLNDIKDRISDRNMTELFIQELHNKYDTFKENYDNANASGRGLITRLKDVFGLRHYNNTVKDTETEFSKSASKVTTNLIKLKNSLKYKKKSLTHETENIYDLQGRLKDAIGNAGNGSVVADQILANETYTYVFDDADGLSAFKEKYDSLSKSKREWVLNISYMEQYFGNLTGLDVKVPEDPYQMHEATFRWNHKKADVIKYDPNKHKDKKEVNNVLKDLLGI